MLRVLRARGLASVCCRTMCSSVNVHLDSRRPEQRATETQTLWTEDTIYCWHPARPFPYEHSRPIERDEAAAREPDSPLKVQLLQEEAARMQPDGPSDRDLMKMFHTSKYTWYYKPVKKYFKKEPKDRDHI